MRRVTRNFLVGMALLLLLLLALGALPSYLRSGDPYYVVATPVDAGGNASESAVEASRLTTQRYPFTTEALSNATATDAGRSSPYWRGPLGIKGAFTHSPFDESDALRQQYPAAVAGDAVRIRDNSTLYRVAVTQTV